MQLFGLDITGEHVKLLLPLIGGAVAAGGFLAGRWSSHRKRVLFRNEDLVSSSIVIELYGIAVDSDGFPMLHIVTQGGSSSIEDFFHNPLRSRLETLLAQAEKRGTPTGPSSRSEVKKKEYRGRIWITRPRPGIDRVSSAWLIRKFIDENAKFVFDNDPSQHPSAVPFDMFQTEKGFGHRGEDCTFETLCKEFAIHDRRVRAIAQIIHDADLEDKKFGRSEGIGIDRTLIGWAKQGVSDEELLRRGMEMIEGLYVSVL